MLTAKRLLIVTAVGEAATGAALLIVPSLVGRLLLGEALSGAAIPVGRVTGIALIALGIACWPGNDAGGGASRALPAMLGYNLFATLYLAYLGLGGEWVGSLLWPAVALHAVLTVLLARMWFGGKNAPAGEDR